MDGLLHPDPEGRLRESAERCARALDELLSLPKGTSWRRAGWPISAAACGETGAVSIEAPFSDGFSLFSDLRRRRRRLRLEEEASEGHRAFFEACGNQSAAGPRVDAGVHLVCASDGGPSFPVLIRSPWWCVQIACSHLDPNLGMGIGTPEGKELRSAISRFGEDLSDNGLRVLAAGRRDDRSSYEKVEHRMRLLDAHPGFPTLLARRKHPEDAVVLHRLKDSLVVLWEARPGVLHFPVGAILEL